MRKLFATIVLLTVITTGIFALTVQGTVTDSETGLGIEGVTVRFVFMNTELEIDRGNGNGYGHGHGQGSGGGAGYNVYTVITNADGEYIIEDLPEGVYNALARKQGSYPSVKFEGVEIFSDTVFNFELIAGNCEPPSRSKLLFQGRK
ncbi:carboxypeptidase-like regulatory domain-containing protein [Candidatus Cloacimonadota bacterium]